YKIFVFILVGFSLVISNLGLTKLIAVSVPVLSAIYPPAISVIMLSLCASFFKKPSHVFAPVSLVALIFGIFDGLKVAGFDLPSLLQNLPISEWIVVLLIPSMIVLLITAVTDRIRN